jgi:hypothetical protein
VGLAAWLQGRWQGFYSNGSGKFSNKPEVGTFAQRGGTKQKGRSSAAPFANCPVDQFLV